MTRTKRGMSFDIAKKPLDCTDIPSIKKQRDVNDSDLDSKISRSYASSSRRLKEVTSTEVKNMVAKVKTPIEQGKDNKTMINLLSAQKPVSLTNISKRTPASWSTTINSESKSFLNT